MAVVGISVRDAVEDFRLSVRVAVVSVTDSVSGRVAVVSRLARDLIAVVVPESRHRSVGVGSCGHVVDAVVSISVVRQCGVCACLVQDVGGAIGAVERVRDRRAVCVDLPGLTVGVVLIGKFCGLFCRFSPIAEQFFDIFAYLSFYFFNSVKCSIAHISRFIWIPASFEQHSH